MLTATIASNTYEWLLGFHILAAAIWVGSGVLIQVLTFRAGRAGADAELAYLAGEAEWFGTRFLIPSSLAVVVLGFLLIGESDGAWELSQTWISIGLGVWILSFLAGVLYLGPESGRIEKLSQEKGPSDPEYQRRLRRLFLVSRIELVLLIAVVLDMAIKPGI